MTEKWKQVRDTQELGENLRKTDEFVMWPQKTKNERPSSDAK